MKKVLITGGAGFIGSNLVRRLASHRGIEVFIIEKKGTDMWRLHDVLEKITLLQVDLEDKAALYQAVNKIKPSIVFHLAGYGAYPAFQNDVRKMVDININGTLNLIDSLKSCPVKAFVNIGSCSEYKEKKSSINEEDPTDPADFYAITKLASVLLLQQIAKENNVPIINLRLFNVYGYYGNNEALIPHIILNALKNNSIKLTSPDNVRDFIFIDDVIDLFFNIMKSRHNYRGEIFNVGSGTQRSVKEIVSTIEELLGKKVHVKYGKKHSHYRETHFFQADSRKAEKAFDWKTSDDFASGIIKTIDWFKKNQALYL